MGGGGDELSNIFTTENIQKYNTKSGRTSGIGEWVTRNGEPTIRLLPEPFYQNFTINDSKISYLLKDEFVPNIQYVFNFYIDRDEVIYKEKNVNAGVIICYTDGTKDYNLYLVGGSKGFVHTQIITPENKSIDHVEVGYYVNQYVYYRWDSYICPVSDIKTNKNGIFNCGNIIENNDSVSFGYGANIHLNDIIEY